MADRLFAQALVERGYPYGLDLHRDEVLGAIARLPVYARLQPRPE